MQTSDGDEETTVESNDEEIGASGLVPEPVVAEVTEVEEGQGDFSEVNDKSEISDEDFRSIKTVDDNATDFEGRAGR